IMTKHGAQLVAPLTFATLSNNPVCLDPFESPTEPPLAHIELARNADVVVVAPATANIIAKMACGIADDLLSTTLLVVRAPIIVAPAMETNMYEHPATQANLETLRKRGIIIVEPEAGWLASGKRGKGRLAPINRIIEAIECALTPRERDLDGWHIIVTAGATREAIDPVRFISNRSSGKMGCAIAEAAFERGAQVTLVCGYMEVPPPAGVNVVQVETTQEMLDAILEQMSKQSIDVLISAGAPCDFRPKATAQQKIKRTRQRKLVIELVRTPDILTSVRKHHPHMLLVGFAAETENLIENAKVKLKRKKLDMIVANDVTQPGAGFGSDTNVVSIITRNGDVEELPMLPKREVAHRILNRIKQLRNMSTQ
ncbi:MAG TPA: bifunctional phosphopantothenoylcysteine decarboxylase/phosphopantothenate--cysteine ligase CoaBC, partial [Armatimonadetes bacterium]|nr:bifunctional phosphopantothenoylcysteine decarboxylase/phosphopantothenate--cysteine ligase CoaBC [Armatimonadota bacterium]